MENCDVIGRMIGAEHDDEPFELIKCFDVSLPACNIPFYDFRMFDVCLSGPDVDPFKLYFDIDELALEASERFH